MNSVFFKRPSSARRSIKQETFTPFVSGSRLRNVQALLNDGSKEKRDLPDAILCIGGIDSRYNDGMLELINYLLFGFFEVRKSELEESGFEEEIIDDVLFLVQHDQVDVYCNPVNYHYLLPYISHWKNIHFHCLTDSEYEDDEKAEDFKTATFVSLVRNCQKVGVPYYNSAAQVQTFDPMLIEKWPIIQVYGVEQVGGGTFFTLRHEVIDVSAQVHQMYCQMDPVALEALVIEQISKLERQWATMLSTVDVTLTGCSNLTEDKVSEPLRSFYVHGRASRPGGDNDRQGDSVPFVLFGTNSCRKVLEHVQNGHLSKSCDLSSTCFGTHGANSMVCRIVSPRGPVTCSRTYFFTRQFVNPFQEARVAEYEGCSDLRLMTVLYGCVIDAVLMGIQVYSSTLSLKQAADVAMETLRRECVGIGDGVVAEYLKRNSVVSFCLQAVDSGGCIVGLVEGQRSLLVKNACICLHDIPSLEKPSSEIGSIIFSESFLDSQIKIQGVDGSIHLDSTYLLLTDHIPRHQTWAYANVETDRKLFQAKLEADITLDNFGKLLLSGDPVHLGCGNTLCMPPKEATLYAYENGLVLLCPQYGAIVLHGNHITSARFYDGDSSSTVALLVLEYQSTFLPFLPFYLQNEECQLILLFTPKSKAYQHLYTDVLHAWREDTYSDSPKVKRVKELPDNCQLLYNLVQHRYNWMSAAKVKTPLQMAASSLPHLYRFLDHFCVSSAGWYTIPESELCKVLQRAGTSDNQNTAENEIVVTILSGIPGSHQDQMCDVLSNLSKEQNRYVILKPPVDGIPQFSHLDIQAKLKATLNVHRRRKKTQMAMRNTRVLYIVPGYTDIVSVIHAVECHPDPDVRAHCIIGSVTACVDPLNVFMEHKYTFPHLLNNCAQGWVNQIVMTSSTALKNDDLEAVQHLLRSVNSDVAFLLAEQGNVSRSMDLDAILSEDSFHQSEKCLARYLSCPGWRQGLYKPQAALMTSVQLRFSLPLDRHKLTSKLKGLKLSLTSYPFSGNIYNIHGKIRFTGGKPDEVSELQHMTMSGITIVKPYTETAQERAAITAGNCLVFTGCQLDVAKLKDWLRECAPQKPEKKSLITRKDVTADVVKKIHKEHHLECLPEGWFYNGTQYVSFDGTKQDVHPNLETFINLYIEEKNTEITERNNKMEEIIDNYKDLFPVS